MFGNLIGAGIGGYVFQSDTHDDRCYKIVSLPDKPLKFYGLQSDVGRVYGINENQADLFYQLSNANDVPSSLPKVYQYYEGNITLKLLEATRQENFYLPLTLGQPIAVWEMEKIPCLLSNNFCDVTHPEKQPLENRQYQSMLHYLLDNGWVVRDIAGADNYGYRRNGEQVWFDPVVAPWPKSGITKSMKNSSNPSKAALYDSFVTAYGSNQLSILHQAIKDKRYFSHYHQGGVLQAEEMLEESIWPPHQEPNTINPKLFYDTWRTNLFNLGDYRVLNTLNFFYPPEWNKEIYESVFRFWDYLYNGDDEDSYMGMVQILIESLGWDEDKNHEGYEVFEELTPNNLISILWHYTTNTTTKRVYGKGDKRYVATTKIIPPDLDAIQQQTIADRELILIAQMSSPNAQILEVAQKVPLMGLIR